MLKNRRKVDKMLSCKNISVFTFFLAIFLQNTFCSGFVELEFEDENFPTIFDFSNETANDSIVFDSSINPIRNNNHIRKCCSYNERVIINANGSLHCASRNEKRQDPNSSHWNEDQISKIGLPNCSYITVANDKHRWFRYTSEVEVGFIYLLYPVWSQTKGDYCIDDYYHESELPMKIHENSRFMNESSLNTSITRIRKEVLAFCDVEELVDFYFKTGLTLFLLITSVGFNCATITVYIVARKVHSSREWTQFFIFVAECVGNVSYCVIIISQSYYFLWKDSIKFVTYWLYLGYYMYTTKFALVIATSIDLLLCVWRPFSAVDERTRAKRNRTAIVICYALPLLIPGITYICEHIHPSEKSGSVTNSNQRILDGTPKFYGQLTKLVFVVEMVVNIIFAIVTTVLIKRQERKKTKIKDDHGAQKNIKKSFGLYIRLIFATELPFSINFVLLIWLSSYSPLSLWWNFVRGTYLVSAVYTFMYFACNKKNKKQLKRLLHTSVSSSAL